MKEELEDKEKDVLTENENIDEIKNKDVENNQEKEEIKPESETVIETNIDTENKEENKVVNNETKNLESESENKDSSKFKKTEKVKNKDYKKMNSSKKKKWIILTVIIGILIVVALFFSTIFALTNINNEKMISGLTIEGIEISGLTKEEAKSKLETIYNEKKEKEINLKYEDYENSLNPSMLEVNYDIEKAINEAYLLGRSENIFKNNYDILFSLISKKDINVEMTLNEDITKQTIEGIGVNLPGIVIESSYAIEDDELIITKGKEGIAVETEKLMNLVKDRLNDIYAKDDYIDIPVINQKPKEIDIQKIHDEVYKEAKDAYYTKDPFEVYPEVVGIDFDVEEAKKILEEDKEEYVIKLTLTQPKVTLSQIGSEAFPDRLSYFTTRYDPGDVDRSTNLRIACEKLNGKVIMPGETFSYNKALGPRTVAAGYKNGKIYENGKVVDGIGGGICQISSTLYNAVLEANLEIVERRNHQFVTSYVGAGRDATVVYGVTDFKFKNTRKYPVRLVASSKNGVATVSIYGIKEDVEYTFDFKTNPIGTIPFTTQYIEDPTLPEGTEEVEQNGVNGLKTETYIIKKLNGKIVSTELLSRDTYSAMTRIVRKGTKKVDATAPANTEPVTPETPEIPEIPETPQNPEEPETPPTDATDKPEDLPEEDNENEEQNVDGQ